MVRRSWRLLVLGMILAVLTSYFVASRTDPTYEAQVEILVGPINTDLDTLRAAGQLAQTYAELATSRPVLVATINKLRLQLEVGQLRRNVVATANDSTRVLTIRVRNRDPALGARIANTLANQVAALARSGASPPAAGQLRIVDAAQPTGRRSGPPIFAIGAVAALAALAGALALVLLMDYLSNTVKGGHELAPLAQVAFLGSFRRARGGLRRSKRPLVVRARPQSSEAAAYRLLAAKIEGLNATAPLRSLLVVGADDTSGGGELAANLAATLTGRVTLVDANVEGGDITAMFGLEEREGMTELLDRNRTPPQWLESRLEVEDGFEVLPLGSNANGAVLEHAKAMTLLKRLLTRADVIVVNAEPVDRSSNALVWARAADATLLVVHGDQTRRQLVSDAAESLRLVGANLIGTVLSERRR